MMFDTRRIVAAAGENVVKVYDKTDGRHWDCGSGEGGESGEGGSYSEADYEDVQGPKATATVERVRIKDGFLIEGRKDGVVGIWTC